MKNKYCFSKKYDFWTDNHYNNFNLIKNIFKNKKNLKFMEIGILEGRTSIWLLENILTRKDSTLTCIEPVLLKKTIKNLSFFSDKVSIINKPSYLALIDLNYKLINNIITPFDFIYIDGDHNAHTVLQDIILSWKLLKPHGILLMDDYEMEIRDPYFYKSHIEFLKSKQETTKSCLKPTITFIHPKTAIDSFLSIYRGLYELIINNYQVGVKKITDFTSDYQL